MTQEETVRILSMLKSAGYSVQTDELTAGAWYTVLGDLPYESVLKAVHIHMRDSEYPPNTGRIRSIVVGREQLVPIPATDVRGRTILREDGTPSVERWERRRVGGLLPEGHPALSEGAPALAQPEARTLPEGRSHVGDVLNGLTRGLGD